MLHIRALDVDAGTVEDSAMPLKPNNEQGMAVCKLWREFLYGRPGSFRARLEFLNREDFEIEWSSGPGATALAGFLVDGEPLAFAALLSGSEADADEEMREVLTDAILRPIAGDAAPETLAGANSRPLLYQVLLPGAPELKPAFQLLAATLASVYFESALPPDHSALLD